MCDLEDFHKFLREFDIQVVKDVDLGASPFRIDMFGNSNLTATEQIRNKGIPGYNINISTRQLTRLLRVLKSKGYLHDDDYEIRMQEEDLILNNPDLKDLHNQYKTLLYMLCGQEYKE